MDFSARLRQLRMRYNLTQEQLGKKVGVTKVSISGYESGNRTPDMETLQKIADVFQTTVDYLLGRSNQSSNTDDEIHNPEINVFFKDFLNAPEERQREMMEIWEIIKKREVGRKPGDKQGES